ncbi:tyrosine-type recombinase/integrase [Paucibacter sp. JuS9]|uniref:Arm DNA-binding domain-containing protein n=1 Tax=Paucibacter sp. JuS9 TaxID=3228748 RepID=UPI003757DB65
MSIREFKTERRIQVAFSFRGTECRELLPPAPITQSALTYAGGLRAEILRKIADDTFHYPDYFPKSSRAKQLDSGRRTSMRTLLDRQLDLYERQHENGALSPSTLDGYRKAINSERMKFWDEMALGEVTPSKLRDWIGALGVTPKRARNLLTPLRSVFEDALNDELIDYNPFDRIALGKLLRQTTKASDYEVDPFTAAERATLLDHARADERPMLQFWMNTGLRPGELMALRWGKVDWVANKARIDRNLVAKTEKGPKTAAGIRDVDLNADAIAGLTAQKGASFLAGEHIWLNPRNGMAWETDAQIRRTLWEPLCKRSGVRYRNPYQVRHSYASALLTAGANPWYVAQQLGHVDVQMVFRVYGKFISQDYQRPQATAQPLASEA